MAKKVELGIDDQIFFVEGNVVRKEVVIGISTYKGDVETFHDNNSTKDGSVIRLLHYQKYYSVNEKEAFRTENELKEHLFSNIKSEITDSTDEG